MTFEDARQAIYTRLKTYWDEEHPQIPVNWGNRERVDLLDQDEPFIGCKVIFDGGEQKSIEETDPLVRYFGCVYLPVFVKEGAGEALQNSLMQELADLFKTTVFSRVTTRAPIPMPPEHWNGWWKKTLRVEFWFDHK